MTPARVQRMIDDIPSRRNIPDNMSQEDFKDLRELLRADTGFRRFGEYFHRRTHLPRKAVWKEEEIDLLRRAGLARFSEGVPQSAYRIHRIIDGIAGNIFVTTDFPEGYSDQVWPWKDEAEVLLKYLHSKIPRDPEARVLVMCCGAGTIAMVLAVRWPHSTIVAVDNNPRAIERAKYNAELNDLAGRITFKCADLFSKESPGEFHIVVADPPFALQPPGVTVPMHSAGGDQGDLVLKRLIEDAPRYLQGPGARLVTLAYSLGTEAGATGLEEHLRRAFYGGRELPSGTIVPLKDELVWRVGEEKSFRNPMPVRYIIIRYNDPTYQTPGRQVTVRTYEAWLEDLIEKHKTHLHYLLIDARLS